MGKRHYSSFDLRYMGWVIEKPDSKILRGNKRRYINDMNKRNDMVDLFLKKNEEEKANRIVVTIIEDILEMFFLLNMKKRIYFEPLPEANKELRRNKQ